MDKDTIVCIAGGTILLAILIYVAVLAWKTARQAPPTLVDRLPHIFQLWRDARTRGERALIVLAMGGTAIRRGGQFLVALSLIGACVSAFAALCSPSTVELLRVVRDILRDILYGLGRPVRPINAP